MGTPLRLSHQSSRSHREWRERLGLLVFVALGLAAVVGAHLAAADPSPPGLVELGLSGPVPYLGPLGPDGRLAPPDRAEVDLFAGLDAAEPGDPRGVLLGD